MAQGKVEICGVNTAKLPVLKEAEKEELFVRIKAGDQEAKDEYIRGNLRLVLSVIKRFSSSNENPDDLFQIGCIGLIKAINTFNPTKNIKLATYASKCIENEILMFLRRNNRIRTEISIDEPLNVDSDGNEMLLSDILSGDDDSVSKNIEDEVDIKLLREAILKLSPREKYIMELRFGFLTGEEKTQKEVADLLQISQSYISRLEKKIISRLKKDIASKI